MGAMRRMRSCSSSLNTNTGTSSRLPRQNPFSPSSSVRYDSSSLPMAVVVIADASRSNSARNPRRPRARCAPPRPGIRRSCGTHGPRIHGIAAPEAVPPRAPAFEHRPTRRYPRVVPLARITPRPPDAPSRGVPMVFDPNDPPAKPSRIIIPGAAPEPTETPRIILPPGSTLEAHDDLPEYPRLRPIQIAPVRDGERELLVVTDPLGVTPGQPVLGFETIAILQLLDGTTSLTDIQALVMQESKDLRVGNMVREFIGKLDEMLLLQSPRFEAALARIQAEWHPLEVRPAALDGVCYPAEHEPLEKFLDAQFAHAERLMAEAGQPAAAPAALPRALIRMTRGGSRRSTIDCSNAIPFSPGM